MTENFFQGRFIKNLKFYEGKTPQELEKAYESVYGAFELQDIYLAELTLIIKALNNEKEIKNDIDFNGFISDISKLYAQIEAMSRKEILENQEQIEKIIVAAKLSLNNPTYFIVDVEQLKTFNLNDELTKFIGSQPAPQNSTTILKDFKKELETEIEVKERRIANISIPYEGTKKMYEQFQDAYWGLVDLKGDPIEYIGVFMANSAINREAKQKLLNAINAMVQAQAKSVGLKTEGMSEEEKQQMQKRLNTEMANKMDDFNKLAISISSGINRRIQADETQILESQRYASILRKLAQSIDENGKLIQLISDELLGQCARQISFSKLNPVAIQLQLLSEQTRVAKKQITLQIAREIEKRTTALTKRRQTRRKPQNEATTILSEQYRDWVDTAKGIVDEELKQDIMIPNEIEVICIEDELQKDDLTPEDIKKNSNRDC